MAPTTARTASLGLDRSALEGDGETLSELGGHLGIGKSFCAWLGDHDQVDRWTDARLTNPEHLAYESLDAVPDHRVPDALAHGHAEARTGADRGTTQQDKMWCVKPPSVALQSQILCAPANAGGLRKALRGHERLSRAASEERSPSDASDACPDAASAPGVHRASPCAPETRACASGGGCSADRSSSSLTRLSAETRHTNTPGTASQFWRS